MYTYNPAPSFPSRQRAAVTHAVVGRRRVYKPYYPLTLLTCGYSLLVCGSVSSVNEHDNYSFFYRAVEHDSLIAVLWHLFTLRQLIVCWPTGLNLTF